MATDIPSDPKTRNQLVQKVSLRYLSSAQHHSDHFDKFRRMERWWRQVREAAAAGDEYAIMLGLAFSVVEGMHAKITEPLFQMGLPCDTYPKKFGHIGKAKNLQHVQRAFYQGPNFQEALSLSKKSMCIVGHRWEFDGFANIQRNGKRWGLVDKKVEVMKDGKKFVNVEQVVDEIPLKRALYYGFLTEFPRWDQVHAEPGRSTIDTGQKTDMTWLIRDLGYLTIESLAKEMQYDVNAKADRPMYDFGELLHASGSSAEKRYQAILDGKSGAVENFGSIIVPQRSWDYQAGRRAGRGDDRLAQAQSYEDRDKVWVVQHREMGEIVTIAQGKYVIHRMLDPWHVPGLKARIENYTTDGTGHLYGKSAIEPVEGELSEMDDIHSLSMQNIFRTVNRMLYVREDAMVSEDDFDPRAGGLVRIKSDQVDVRSAVYESDASSPVNEMLGVEGELRGLIEKVTGELDGGSGADGIAKANKTAKGAAMFVSALSPGYARFQRQARINECRRCMNMADILEQFHFAKMPYRAVQPNGSTAYMEFDRSDLDTGGLGFEFGFNLDPMWGNPQQRLAMKRQVLEDGIKYMTLSPAVRGPNSRSVNVDELFEDVLQESGFSDTSKVFRMPDGAMSPEDEMQILAQGGIVDKCVGDGEHHITTHLLQIKSPQLKAMIDAGKADPQTVRKLQLLVQQKKAEMMTFLANPEGAAQDRLNKSGMVHPGEGAK